MSENLDKLFDSLERMAVDPGRLEAEKHLAAGRPIYYGDESLPDGQYIKEHPDGHKEIVTLPE
jgi:hypothetical protein